MRSNKKFNKTSMYDQFICETIKQFNASNTNERTSIFTIILLKTENKRIQPFNDINFPTNGTGKKSSN
jgi:hypothetical protein